MKSSKKRMYAFSITVVVFLLLPQPIYAMHITEGFLQPIWAISWALISLPFVVYGYISMQHKMKYNPKIILLFAMAGAYTFTLSALKLPSFTGSCSHPTGVGLGAIMFGPTVMSVLSLSVLLFQAVLLAHGGITTLGANVFSMGIIGPFVSFGIYQLAKKLKISTSISVFLAAFMGNIMTYVTTSIQLALAWPDMNSGFSGALIKYLGIFAVSQLPIAVSEGILTTIIFTAILKYNTEIVEELNLFMRSQKDGDRSNAK